MTAGPLLCRKGLVVEVVVMVVTETPSRLIQLRADGRKMKENLGSLPAGMVMTPAATPVMKTTIMGNRDDVTAPEMMVDAVAAVVVVVLGTARKKAIR